MSTKAHFRNILHEVTLRADVKQHQFNLIASSTISRKLNTGLHSVTYPAWVHYLIKSIANMTEGPTITEEPISFKNVKNTAA